MTLREYLEKEILVNQAIAFDTSLRSQTRQAGLMAWQVLTELLAELEERQAQCLEGDVP